MGKIKQNMPTTRAQATKNGTSLIPLFPLTPPSPTNQNRWKRLYLLPLITLLLFATSCEKEIEVDIPDAEDKLVVEGRIEPGLPPIVILTRTMGYFEPTDINAFQEMFVHNADIRVSNGTNEVSLLEICTSSLPDSLLPLIESIIGVSAEELQAFDYCVYTTLDPIMFGTVGTPYYLTVNAEGHSLASRTRIPELVPLDSVWFQLWPGTGDTLGFAWAKLTDPDTVGNAYRWFAQRINSYSDGTQKDPTFIAPFGSAFDDGFFNGLSFEFAYNRGEGDVNEDDTNDEAGFYKVGDTIVVKFCTIEKNIYDFYRAFDAEVFNNGNPFGSPSIIPTNIQGGGLGIWAGYGVTYDTIIAPL